MRYVEALTRRKKMTNITMQELFEAGVHFGHQTRYWNPKMAPYIFGVKHNIHIINLEKTLPLYKDAINFLGSVAAKRGKILFVGTKHAARDTIREEAERCGMPYINNRWLGGTLTNYKTVRQSIKHFKELEAKRDSEEFARLTKKEALNLIREISKLERSLKGIKDMGGLPDALFVIDVGYEKIAISEARKLKIPIVAILDTNRNPDDIDYIIPGNDDSFAAISLYTKHIADAIIEATSNLPIETIIAEKEAKKTTKKLPKAKKKVFTRKESLGQKEMLGDTKAKKPRIKTLPAKASLPKSQAENSKPEQDKANVEPQDTSAKQGE